MVAGGLTIILTRQEPSECSGVGSVNIYNAVTSLP